MGKIVNVGLIGCGLVAQIVHIPTLNFMSDFFRITYLCDVSQQSLEHCQQIVNRVSNPKITKSAEELCSSSDVDVVFVLSSTEFHVPHAVLALKYEKIAFVEKPMALNERDLKLIADAEKASKGTVMVGYMRRYATAFIDAVKEIGGMDQVRYATVRDIIGKNDLFIPQSGMFYKAFSDFSEGDLDEKKQTSDEQNRQGLEVDLDIPLTEASVAMWTLVGNLGAHDISAMREAFGMPTSVLGCSLSFANTFWRLVQASIHDPMLYLTSRNSAIFQYPGFTVHYESGIHDVPMFDAHIEVFSRSKQVKVKWDTPFIKGLPVTMIVREDVDGSGALRETVTTKTYEDPYTLELREFYALAAEGKPTKTTVEDAAQDLKIFQMILKAGAAQVA
jgi:predicted dehydrogenase